MFIPKQHIKFVPDDIGATQQQNTESDSVGSYEQTPPVVPAEETGLNPNCLYPSLVNCDEPIVAIIHNLANRPWMKSAEKCLTENGIFKISDLSKLSKVKAHTFDRVLKAPDSVTTIREALRKFEKTLKKREDRQTIASTTVTATAPAIEAEKIENVENSTKPVDENVECSAKKTGIASIVEETTPEEEDETMRQIYDRPSPSPTEELASLKNLVESQNDETSNVDSRTIVENIELPNPSVAENLGETSNAEEMSIDVEETTSEVAATSPNVDATSIESDDEIQLAKCRDILRRKSRKVVWAFAKELMDMAMETDE
jgi:hypothetical protein